MQRQFNNRKNHREDQAEMRHCEPACRQVDIAQPAIIPKQLSVTFWIFKSCKFQLPVRFRVPLYVITQNFAKIGRTVMEIWSTFDFQNGGRPPCWIFKSWKF